MGSNLLISEKMNAKIEGAYRHSNGDPRGFTSAQGFLFTRGVENSCMPLLEELIKEWSAQELIELNSALRTVPQFGNRYRSQCHSYQERAALLTPT